MYGSKRFSTDVAVLLKMLNATRATTDYVTCVCPLTSSRRQHHGHAATDRLMPPVDTLPSWSTEEFVWIRHAAPSCWQTVLVGTLPPVTPPGCVCTHPCVAVHGTGHLDCCAVWRVRAS